MSFVIKYDLERLKQSTDMDADKFDTLIGNFRKSTGKWRAEVSEILLYCSYIPLGMEDAGYTRITKAQNGVGKDVYYAVLKDSEQPIDANVALNLMFTGEDQAGRKYYHTRVLISGDGKVAVEVAVPLLKGEANKAKLYELAQNLANDTCGEVALIPDPVTKKKAYVSTSFIFPPDYLI